MVGDEVFFCPRARLMRLDCAARMFQATRCSPVFLHERLRNIIIVMVKTFPLKSMVFLYGRNTAITVCVQLVARD